MAQAYLNFQNQNPGYVPPNGGSSLANFTGRLSSPSIEAMSRDEKMAQFGTAFPDFSETAGGGGGGGGLWAGGGSQGALVADPAAQRNAALRDQYTTQLLGEQLKQAQRGGPAQYTYGPTPEAYQTGMNNAGINIQRGLEASRTRTNEAVSLAAKDLQSTLDALEKGYGAGRDALNTGYEEGIDTLTAGKAEGRADLEKNFGEAIDRYNVLTNLAPEAIGEYGDRVLSDFDESFAQYQNSQVYQFALNEGLKGMQRSAAAKGMSQSGAAMKAMQRYATDYASQAYFDYQNSRIGQAKDLAQLTVGGISSQADLQSRLGQNLANLSGMYNQQIGGMQVGRGQDLSALETQLANQQQAAYQTRTSFAAPALQAQAGYEMDAGLANAKYQYEGALGAGQQYIKRTSNNTYKG
jgi:hypothetical protein